MTLENKVPCTWPGCTAKVKKAGLKSHIRMKHEGKTGGFIRQTQAQLADVTAQVTTLTKERDDLKAQLAQPKPAELTDDDRKVVLADWMIDLSKEAWELVGRQKGYLTEAKKEAELAEPKPLAPAPAKETPTDKVRQVYFVEHGVLATETTKAS